MVAIISTSVTVYTAHIDCINTTISYNSTGPLYKPRWPNAKEWGAVVSGTQKQHYLLANSPVVQSATMDEIR
jgi:hypothetical protein